MVRVTTQLYIFCEIVTFLKKHSILHVQIFGEYDIWRELSICSVHLGLFIFHGNGGAGVIWGNAICKLYNPLPQLASFDHITPLKKNFGGVPPPQKKINK